MICSIGLTKAADRRAEFIVRVCNEVKRKHIDNALTDVEMAKLLRMNYQVVPISPTQVQTPKKAQLLDRHWGDRKFWWEKKWWCR